MLNKQVCYLYNKAQIRLENDNCLQNLTVCRDPVAEYMVRFLLPPCGQKPHSAALRSTGIKYLSNSFHWPLAVHLKDATLCGARHPQLMPCVQTDLLFTPVPQITYIQSPFTVVRQYHSNEKETWESIDLLPYRRSSRAAVKSELYVSVHQADSQEVPAACVVAVQQRPVGHRRPKRQLELHEGEITLRGLRPRDDSVRKHCLIEERWGQRESCRVGDKTWQEQEGRQGKDSGQEGSRGVSIKMIKSEEEEEEEVDEKGRK